MKDPTQTASIRQAWTRQIAARFRKLRGRVNTLFTQGKIPYDLAYVEFFEAWLAKESLSLLGGAWQAKYIEEAYLKGLAMSGLADVMDKAHMVALGLLARRATTDTRAALDAMKAQSVDVLTDAILTRKSKREMATLVKDRISKIGETRAKLTANTLTPYAHNTAAVKAVEAAGGEFKMLWITRQDERVRTTHALRNRKLMSAKVAQNLLGEPNCRCRVEPVEVDEKAKKGYKQIRREGLALSKQAQEERRFWATLKQGSKQGFREDERAEGYSGGYNGEF